MVDITNKSNTLRIATAQAIVRVSNQNTIDAIQNNTVPKGNVFEMSKAAGLLGIKKTPDILPDCHPLPIEFASINYDISDLEIIINVTVKTIYKTGVEVEAMHGASIVALNLYDMLKPIDKGIEINNIKLLKKSGGKTDLNVSGEQLTATVIVCSDTVAAGTNEDKSGKTIAQVLANFGIKSLAVIIVPDNVDQIRDAVSKAIADGVQLVISTGGTGLSPKDLTPEAVEPLLDRRLPGVEEAIRSYGQNRTHFAMLSRSVVGTIGNSIVISLPGSSKAVTESLNAVFPAILHAFPIMNGAGH